MFLLLLPLLAGRTVSILKVLGPNEKENLG